MNKALAFAVLGFLILSGWRETTAAEAALTQSEKAEFNYAFATRLGSGIYTISGRTLQVYRLPLSVAFRSEEEQREGWRFTFPLTLGFYDFKAQDIVATGLPQDLATLSLVPGAELFIPVTGNWLLKPYVEAGRVWDRSGDSGAAVYSTGIWSRADFRAGGFDLGLGNGLGYTLVDPSSAPGTESLVTLETALEARHRLGSTGSWAKMDYGLYVVQHVYFSETGYPLSTEEGSGFLDEYEVGFTFGSREPYKIWKIPLPRIGVGYLFGRELSVLRIVFGSPAPSLQP